MAMKVMTLKVSESQRKLWEEAAFAAGEKMSAWMKGVLDKSAGNCVGATERKWEPNVTSPNPITIQEEMEAEAVKKAKPVGASRPLCPRCDRASRVGRHADEDLKKCSICGEKLEAQP